ncbi:MAG: hypothetical protein PHH70_01445, partial [Candidatus Gracilibacteria bacterium]|nr:hypothetical protein [Candidatus Gracilibacteria bacterium]
TQNNTFNEGQHGGFSKNNASFEPLFPDNPRNVIGFKPGVASAVVAGVIASTAAVYGAEFDKPKENIFRSAVPDTRIKKETIELQTLPMREVPERDVEQPLQVGILKPTHISLKPKDLSTPRETKVYSLDGKYMESFPHGTKIMPDPTKPINRTREGETYVYIVGHNNTHDSSKQCVIEPCIIRTTHLDKNINPTAPKTSLHEGILDGYLGYDSRLIPKKALEEATKKYLANKLGPMMQENIAKINTQISETREEIKYAVLHQKKSIHDLPSYAQQKKDLRKKQSLTQIHQAIQSFIANGADAITMNSDVEKVLKSFMKTSEGRDVLNAATAAEKAKIKNRYQGYRR